MKKIISAVLALALILCLFPAAIAAQGDEASDDAGEAAVAGEGTTGLDMYEEEDDDDEEDDDEEEEPVPNRITINDVNNAERFTAALSNTSNELVINVTGSFNYPTPIDLGVDEQNVTVNLRGNQVTVNVPGTAILIKDGVSLTINGPGTLKVYSTGTSTTAYGRGIEAHGVGTIFQMKGGAVVDAWATGVSTGDYDSLAVYAYSGGTINVTNASATGFSGVGAMTAAGGTINILGNAIANGDGYAYGAAAWGGTINIGGRVSGSYVGVHAQNDGVVIVEGSATGTGEESIGSFGASVASGGKVYVIGDIYGVMDDVITDVTKSPLVTRSAGNPTKTGVTFPPPQYGNGYYWDEFTADKTSIVYKRQDKIDDSKVIDFVIRLYNNILDREPDSEGLDGWVTRLKEQTSTGGQVAYGFFFSDEMIKKNLSNSDYVEVLYKTLLDREYDTDGRDFWVKELEAGWPREDVFAGFVNSEEFLQLCSDAGIARGTYTPPAGGGIRVFVTRLYAICLGRQPDAKGLDDWVTLLRTNRATGTEVGYGFIFSSEMNAKNLNNKDFVEILYKAFLGREPDEEGLANWVKVLDNKSQTRQQVFSGFANSKEFGNICTEYGIKQK